MCTLKCKDINVYANAYAYNCKRVYYMNNHTSYAANVYIFIHTSYAANVYIFIHVHMNMYLCEAHVCFYMYVHAFVRTYTCIHMCIRTFACA